MPATASQHKNSQETNGSHPALLRPTASRPPVSADAGASSLPAPEDVFLVWLLGLPDDADVAAAARTEVARLDRLVALPAAAVRLRALLVQATRPMAPRRRGRR